MYLSEGVLVVLRRWYVVLIGLLLTGGLVYAVLGAVPPTYVAQSRILFLLPPESTGRTTPTNPFLNLTGGLTSTAIIVAESVNSGQSARALAEAGLDVDYEVALGPSGTAPVLVVTSEGQDPDVVLTSLAALGDEIDTQLAAYQEQVGAPRNQTITTTVLEVPEAAELQRGDQLRAAGGTLGLGAVLTLVLAVVVDRLVRGRRRGGAGGVGPASEEPDGQTDRAEAGASYDALASGSGERDRT